MNNPQYPYEVWNNMDLSGRLKLIEKLVKENKITIENPYSFASLEYFNLPYQGFRDELFPALGGKVWPTSATPTYIVQPSCSHNQQEVKIGNWSILASEWDKNQKNRIAPNLGVYMTTTWMERIGWLTSAGIALPKASYNYPYIILDWDDGSAFPREQLNWIVNTIIEKIKVGQKVEVGCFGGHGRTGTLLAIVLGVVEDLIAKEAIKILRERYCKKAVETDSQIKLVAEYLGGSVKGIQPSRTTFNQGWGTCYTFENGVLKPNGGMDNAAYGYWD